MLIAWACYFAITASTAAASRLCDRDRPGAIQAVGYGIGFALTLPLGVAIAVACIPVALVRRFRRRR